MVYERERRKPRDQGSELLGGIHIPPLLGLTTETNNILPSRIGVDKLGGDEERVWKHWERSPLTLSLPKKVLIFISSENQLGSSNACLITTEQRAPQ
jgi:hypothetical protein